MARILLVETSTAQLSAALAEDGIVTASRTCDEPRMQASLTAPFVKEILDEKGLSVKDLDAVCVGKGPGSYTGLRVGVSTAKGLCFGAGLPLLSAGTLDVLVQEAHRLGVVPSGCKYVVPMVDARRMEVYAAVFTPEGRQLTETKPVIIDGDSLRPRPLHRRRRPQVPRNPHVPERFLRRGLPHRHGHGPPRGSRLQRKTVRRRGVLRTVLSQRLRCYGLP